jgi:hypothetical protein
MVDTRAMGFPDDWRDEPLWKWNRGGKYAMRLADAQTGRPYSGWGGGDVLGPHRGHHRVLADMGRMGFGEDTEPEGDGEGMK